MSTVVTLEELKTFAGPGVIEDDDRAEQVVAAVNAAIESQTGRVWGETASGSEIHDYADVLYLRNMDVIAVTAVKVNGTTRQSSEYKWRDTGRLVLSSHPSRFRPRYDEVEVTYTDGNPEVPDDLKQAALSISLDEYNYVADGEQREVTSESIGSLRYTYATGKDSSTGSMHAEVISRYKVRHG